jgi:hypothetical protein
MPLGVIGTRSRTCLQSWTEGMKRSRLKPRTWSVLPITHIALSGSRAIRKSIPQMRIDDLALCVGKTRTRWRVALSPKRSSGSLAWGVIRRLTRPVRAPVGSSTFFSTQSQTDSLRTGSRSCQRESSISSTAR